MLDKKLNWKTHLNELAKKLSRSIGLIAKMKPYCSKSVLRSLYFSLFQSHLSYGIAVWGGNITDNQLSRLDVLQNRILKLIFSSPNDDPPTHASQIRKSFRIWTVEDQIRLEMTSLMWDYDHNLLPYNFKDFFWRSNLVHGYEIRSAVKGSLFYSKVNTTSFEITSFKHQGGKILNDLLQIDLYLSAKDKR